MKEKHLEYYTLLDALKAEMCPICHLVREKIDKYFQTLLYENINDVGFRKKFKANGGFCNFHSYQFMNYNDGLAIAITHQDLLKAKIENFERSFFKKNIKAKKCMLCEYITEIETRYIKILIEYSADEQVVEALLNSEGLCIPHFELLLDKAKKLNENIFAFHIKKYKQLACLLEDYIQSCNYSLGDKRPKLDEKQMLIWKKAVETLYGLEGKTV